MRAAAGSNHSSCGIDEEYTTRVSTASEVLLLQKQQEMKEKEIEEEEESSFLRKAANMRSHCNSRKDNSTCMLSSILDSMHSSNIHGGNRKHP